MIGCARDGGGARVGPLTCVGRCPAMIGCARVMAGCSRVGLLPCDGLFCV